MTVQRDFRKEPAVGSVQLHLDQRTLDRIQALAALQQDALPGVPYGPEDAARQALRRGLDLMLSELLVCRSRPEGTRPA